MVPTFLTYFFSPHLRLEIHSYIVCAKKKKRNIHSGYVSAGRWKNTYFLHKGDHNSMNSRK